MRVELHVHGLTPRVIRNLLKIKRAQLQAPTLSPCRSACPLGQDIPMYLKLIAQGKFAEAAAVIRRDNPLPSVCGHACAHPCESVCRQGEIGQPLNIMRLKRFAIEWAAAHEPVNKENIPALTAGPVAIVGSGPAGLAAADKLVRNGIKTTVFERAPKPGGMLRLAIPEFTLPAKTLDFDIELLRKNGVEFKCGTAINDSNTVAELLAQGFKAVIICCGAWKAVKPAVPGCDLAGNYDGLHFLVDVKNGKINSVPAKMLVIGGGETAVDVARTAVRLGGKATILYRRSTQEMPIAPESLKLLADEGIRIDEGVLPDAVLGTKRVTGLRAKSVRYMDSTTDGLKPVFEDCPPRNYEADMIVWAVGEEVEEADWAGTLGVKFGKGGRILADARGKAAANVYAAGDIVSGPSSIVAAMASGRNVALSVIRDLGVTPSTAIPAGPAVCETGADVLGQRMPLQLRPLNGFEDREFTFTARQAVQEAGRCLQCGQCAACSETSTADTLFFSGCNGRFRFRDSAKAAKSLLRKAGVNFVEGQEVCCGSPALWGGDLELANALKAKNVAMFKAHGIKKIITACADCAAVLAHDYGLSEEGIEVEHFAVTAAHLVATGALQMKSAEGMAITYHDPCQLAREKDGVEAPRQVFGAITGLTLKEMQCHGRSTQCCGGGPNSLVALTDPALAKGTTQARLDQAKQAGVDTIVTACSWCRARLATQAADNGLTVVDLPEFLERMAK